MTDTVTKTTSRSVRSNGLERAVSDQTFAQFAQAILTGLHESLVSFEAPAKTGETEAVHDMRVTSRRMRVALSNFAVCLPRDYRKGVRAGLSTLADTLGKVRDLDVMLEEMNRILPGQPVSRRSTIEKLKGRLRTRRKYHFKRLIEYLASAEYRSLKAQLKLISEKIDEVVHERNGEGAQSQKNSAA